MNQNIIIALSVITGVVVILAAKIWIHNIIKFKMDESAILNCLKEVSPEQSFLSRDEISQEISIDTDRISQVCLRSQLIIEYSHQKNSWRLK